MFGRGTIKNNDFHKNIYEANEGTFLTNSESKTPEGLVFLGISKNNEISI